MRCSSSETCAHLRPEFHSSSFAVEREGPVQFSVSRSLLNQEWGWVGSRTYRKSKVKCFLLSPSRSSTIPEVGNGTESVKDSSSGLLLEEITATAHSLHQVQVANAELCRERVRATVTDGEPYAEESASGSTEACTDPGTISVEDGTQNLKDTLECDSHWWELRTEIVHKEDMAVRRLTDNTNATSENEALKYVNIMKDCVKRHDLQRASSVHADLVGNGLLYSNVIVSNTLINLYAKCGDLEKAQNVFNHSPIRTIATWNVLIAGFVQHGHYKNALNCFERMQQEGFHPNAVTFTCILKACGNLGDSAKGQEIHEQILQEGLLDINVHVGTALVDMYGKCGLLSKAQEVFDKLPDRNVVTWTALIVGYAQYDYGEEALGYFEQMQLEGFSPDGFTFTCVLKACCSTGNVVKGKEIHDWVAREGLLEKNVVLVSALVDMYTKCGELEQAQLVFDSLSVRDKVAWTALITGYALHGHAEKALMCYEQMLEDSFSPNEVTFAGVLKACTSLGDLDKGQEVHAQIIREGLLNKDAHIGTALVDMYGKWGLTAIAEEVFENLAVWDVATWTALITAFAQHEQADEAFDCFKHMLVEGIYPDAVTFSCILTACGNVAAADIGQRLHVEVIKLGLVEEDMIVGTALVDMYVNCGMLLEARGVFDTLDVRDEVTWNALMGGYAQLGDEEAVFKLANDMIAQGKDPDAATFTIVLNMCSHRGLTDKAVSYFEMLSSDYGIIPNTEQYTCMVDLFGRAGQLDKAVALILLMPFCANLTVWTTLLSACRKWGSVKLGKWAFDQTVDLDEENSSAYICMSNIYAAAGRKEDADKIEAMRIARQAWSINEGVLSLLLE